MRYERLSKQEQMLFEVFQEVNAMTYEQVKQFIGVFCRRRVYVRRLYR